MVAETILLRLASVLPAALGTWSAAALTLCVFRVRDATLRAALWTWAALTPLLVVAGVTAGGFSLLRIVVPAGYFLFRDGVFAASMLVVWSSVAVALVARRAACDARLTACIEGVAAASLVPADLMDAVEHAARWLGVAAPRVAVCETGGTAFVAGVRSPVLCVPLELWRRLDPAGRRAMLLHELAHVRRRDPARLRALSFLVDVFWPAFPLRWIAARLRDAWEAQADEEAIQGGAARSALARSLVEASSLPSPAGVLAFGGSAGATARRLAALRRRPRAATLALQILLLAVYVPWCPGWNEWGVSLRMAAAGDEDLRGVVTVGFGGTNPLSDALARPMLEEGQEAVDEPGAPDRSSHLQEER